LADTAPKRLFGERRPSGSERCLVRLTDAPDLVPPADGIVDEHRRLHVHLDAVEAALSGAGPPEAAPVAGLASALAELAPFLRAHFAREEEEGLFDRVLAAWPHAAAACECLLDEHTALVARLERLRAEAEEGPATGESLATLRARARSFLEDLGRHEELENELIVGALDDAMAAQD
jgi:hemerythrin-like domain-containing protein